MTRLYHFNDPKHPHVLHGNTCAFVQDVISTATVLPRVASDMADCISVIFTGPKREIMFAELSTRLGELGFVPALDTTDPSWYDVDITRGVQFAYWERGTCWLRVLCAVNEVEYDWVDYIVRGFPATCFMVDLGAEEVCLRFPELERDRLVEFNQRILGH